MRYTRIEQVENTLIESEMGHQSEGNLRILLLKTFNLRLDALNQHASKQIDRHNADLRHAQRDLALHNTLEPGLGDAGKCRLNQFVVISLEDPARQFAIRAGI